jgi:hypothetical protein
MKIEEAPPSWVLLENRGITTNLQSEIKLELTIANEK